MHGMSHFLSNNSLSGANKLCNHHTDYFVTPNTQVKMCTGLSHQDLKNGMTIIKLIESRGYLPTCRVLQLLMWMSSQVSVDHNGYPMHGRMQRDFVIDLGANIGSCSVHMAALGFPVISVEPVIEHVNTILGTMSLNPSFHMDVFRMGISSSERLSRINFGHGARNWGATNIVEVMGNETAEELQLTTTDHVIGHRRVALMKVDCEGCEFDALRR
jgi:FkbM family methyltransferase